MLGTPLKIKYFLSTDPPYVNNYIVVLVSRATVILILEIPKGMPNMILVKVICFVNVRQYCDRGHREVQWFP